MRVETPPAPDPPAAASPLPASSSSVSPSVSPSVTPTTWTLPSLRRRQFAPRHRALVLFDPEGAFAATLARPRMLACLIVAALFSLAPPTAFYIAASQGGGYESVLVQEMKKSGRWAKIPPSARERALKTIVPASKMLLPVGAVAKRLMWIVSCAALCFALLRATRPGLRLATLVAVAAVGTAPLFVHDVFSAVALWATDDLGAVDATNIVLSNPAAWWWPGAAGRSPWAVLGRSLDMFDLWACVWIAVGLGRAVGGRTSVPWVVVFGLDVLVALVSVAQAAFAQR